MSNEQKGTIHVTSYAVPIERPLPPGWTREPDGRIRLPTVHVNQQGWEEQQTDQRFQNAMDALQRWIAGYESDRMQGKFVSLEPIFVAIKQVQSEA